MGPCGPSGSFLWLGLGASQLLLFSGHLGITDQAWLKVSPGGGGGGECLRFALISSFFGFLLFMARETGFPFLVVTPRFPFEIYLLK